MARVSRRHLYRLIERGTVPAIRVGDESGPLRVPADEFRAWLYADDDSGGEAA